MDKKVLEQFLISQNTNHMNDDLNSKLLSTQQSNNHPSSFVKFISIICPCFNFRFKSNLSYQEETEMNICTYVSLKENPVGNMRKVSQRMTQIKVKQPQEKSIKVPMSNSLQEKRNKFMEEEAITQSTIKKWFNYPIYKYKQDALLVLGDNRCKMLAKISTVKLQPSREAKRLSNKSKIYERNLNIYSRSNLDKYWNKRYHLFEKFDEGISINQQAWAITVPQALSEHVASSIKCQIVLNAFCGVGGDAIKLAYSCNKVIATDTSESNLKSLYFNAKIYSVEKNINIVRQNEIENQNEPEIILISNYNKIQQDCLINNSISPLDFKPNLKNILSRALKFCQNIVLILPANVDIDKISQIFAEEMMEQSILAQTCYVRIQKIFYTSQLKYLVVYFGAKVNKETTINDELEWIYNCLNKESKKHFAHKKLIKKLRQVYGMVKLLNTVLQANKMSKNEESQPFQRFCAYISSNNILAKEQLQKILEDQKNDTIKKHKNSITNDKQNKTQDKIQPESEIERTISYFSQTPSLPSEINRVQTDRFTEGDEYKSVVIKNSSYTSPSMIKSFGNLRIESRIKKQEDEQNGQRQNSDVIQFYKLS